jgi:hypothetical protein
MFKFQKDKIMNIPFVNNIVFDSNSNDNFLGLLTNQTKQGDWGLFMKRNQQMTNKKNTVLLK